jgi:ubiquinone/menaquinone biosynthesis C-methylase UbiE
MKKTDIFVNMFASDIENKDILEVACGTADFSISAIRIANSVSCIDLDDNRLNNLAEQNNVTFQIMDAAKMSYPDNTFDVVVIYNSFFHIHTQWNEIEKECKRVLKSKGTIYVVGTWKLDTNLMVEIFGDNAFWQDDFLVVKIVNI